MVRAKGAMGGDANAVALAGPQSTAVVALGSPDPNGKKYGSFGTGPNNAPALPAPPVFQNTGAVVEETKEEKRERIRKENLSLCGQICIFFTFLIIFTTAMLLEQSASSSRLADHVRAKLDGGTVPLNTVASVPALYDYLQQVFVPAMYENNTDTNMAIGISQHLHPIDLSNRIVGNVRLRQVRVALTDDCQVGPLFEFYKVQCYPGYAEDYENKDSFGPDMKFTYKEDPNGPTYSGSMGTYGPNGYMLLLSTNATKALVTLSDLETDSFLGPATRALFVDYTIWNQNIGSYAVVTIALEFGATGGVVQSVDILTMTQAILVPGGLGFARDWAAFLGVVIIMLFVGWFLMEEIKEIYAVRLEYFYDGWNILDWINMILLIIAFVARSINFADAAALEIGAKEIGNRETLDRPATFDNNFTSLRVLAERAELVKLLHAFNAVLLWGKVVKYLRHLPMVKDLIRTVWDAFELFLPFLVMFTVGLTGFAISYNVGFGDKIWELATFGRAVVYLCRAFLRDIKLMPAYEITPAFGAMLILLFYVTLVLVGANLLFAIIADALFRAKYSKVKKHHSHEDEPLEEFYRTCRDGILTFMQNRTPWLYHKFCKKRKQAKKNLDGTDGSHDDTESLTNPKALRDGSPGLVQAAQAALDDRASSYTGYSQEDDEFFPTLTRDELMRAIEHMSGRVLSEISIVGIEIRSELHDVCERVAQMQMACEELTWRVDKIRVEQEVEM